METRYLTYGGWTDELRIMTINRLQLVTLLKEVSLWIWRRLGEALSRSGFALLHGSAQSLVPHQMVVNIAKRRLKSLMGGVGSDLIGVNQKPAVVSVVSADEADTQPWTCGFDNTRQTKRR